MKFRVYMRSSSKAATGAVFFDVTAENEKEAEAKARLKVCEIVESRDTLDTLITIKIEKLSECENKCKKT